MCLHDIVWNGLSLLHSVSFLHSTFCGAIVYCFISCIGVARSDYADCLKRHIGKHWQQLAYHLGATKTEVDSIVLKHTRDLKAQVDDFLEMARFPDLGQSTMILILVALRAAGLDSVEDQVFNEAVNRGR